MKGAYPFLSHSTLLVVGIIVMGMVVISFSNFLSRTERDLVDVELNYIADYTKDKVFEIYNLANSSSEYFSGDFKLKLPEKIGNRKYTISFQQNALSVSASVENELIEVTRLLNIDATFNGTSYMPASINIEKLNGNILISLVD